jgi:hypothetical protein
VYEAQGPQGGHFAVKILDPEAARRPDSARRFVREARAVMSIESDHVVKLADAGTEGEELPFLVMELLHGYDLGRVVERLGALKPDVLTRLFAQACRGLAAAHAKGIIHRDIKPPNLFLHELPSGEVLVKLCDFGVAKQLVAEDSGTQTAVLTRTGGVIGSPMYMSPEQAKNARVIDARTDVWSIGASMFEALSGVRPWQGFEAVGELIVAICTAPMPLVQDRAPWVPAALAEIVGRAMERNAAERYATVRELGEALERLAGGRLTLRVEEIAPVTGEERRAVAERAATADSRSVSGAEPPSAGIVAGTLASHGGEGLAQSVAAPPVRSRKPLVAAVGAAGGVAVVAVLLALTLGRSERPAPDAAAPPTASTTQSAVAVATESREASASATASGATAVDRAVAVATASGTALTGVPGAGVVPRPKGPGAASAASPTATSTAEAPAATKPPPPPNDKTMKAEEGWR